MKEDSEFVELVTIVESADPALLMVMKSVLDGAEIEYYAKGEQLQNLFGAGQIGIGFNPIIGPVRIQVRGEDAERSRTLLRDFLDTGGTDNIE